MKLRQLQCVYAIVANGYSVTLAAASLHMSQPAVSKQIKILEEMLGSQIFKRSNKSFTGLTAFGDLLFPEIEKVLSGIDNIKKMAGYNQSERFSQLHIATTNTLANYASANVISYMQRTFPAISLNIIEGTNAQILEALNNQEADFGWISVLSLDNYQNALRQLIYLPAMDWKPVLVMPKKHELSKKPPKTLNEIAKYPLITYASSFKGVPSIAQVMAKNNLSARVVLTARSPELIKSYVRSEMGIGVIADIAIDEERDSDLIFQRIEHLVGSYQTYLLWHESKRLRDIHYELIEQIVPDAKKQAVQDHIRRVKLKYEPEGWAI